MPNGMFSIALILICSLVLFAYWFRYSCLLILQTRTRESTMRADAPSLNYTLVQEMLRKNPESLEAMDRLRQDLGKDYDLLQRQMRRTGDLGMDPIEQRMLLLDYRLMHIWYVATRRLARPQARQALEEMSSIMGYFAQAVGRGGGAEA